MMQEYKDLVIQAKNDSKYGAVAKSSTIDD